MSSVGSGYDLYTTTWSPNGRVFQPEYAAKKADASASSIGVRVNGGVVVAREVPIDHKLQRIESCTYKAIHAVDEHIIFTFSGHKPDALHILARAREECVNYRNTFGIKISVETLVNRMGLYMSQFTAYYSLRPLGCTILLGSSDKNNDSQLYAIDATANTMGYFGVATGKGRTIANSELEKLELASMSVDEAKMEIVKILYRAHDESKDRPIRVQVGVVVNGEVVVLEGDELKMLNDQAKQQIEDEEDEDDDEDDEEDDEDEDEDVQMS